VATRRLGIGFVGSGFNARFHIQSLVAVRDADVIGVWSPNASRAAEAAALARSLDVGNARPFASIADMVADPAIDALWICGPNQARIENIEEMVDALSRGRGRLTGVACEKPLARNVAEAEKVVALVKGAGLAHAYLENQVYAPQVEHGRATIWSRGARQTGRPYLARAAEEHGGPHMPWFWQGTLQGGGVLNDMMCHSALLVRHLLTGPAETIAPKRVTAHIASLKWSRPEYAAQLSKTMGVDYTRTPSEDFASMTIEFEAPDGRLVFGEATTSWSYVGAGLRLSAELLGPEYSMSWNTLNSGLQVFFSRAVAGTAGEDMIEKQNAEIGLMPLVTNEAEAYGYVGENRHIVRAFLRGEKPDYTFDDGLEVVKILMTAYMSAEQGRTLSFPPADLSTFVPQVAKGTWRPQ
jgi:predicted dehydrogenase